MLQPFDYHMNDFVKNFEAKEVKTKEKRKQAKGVEQYRLLQ